MSIFSHGPMRVCDRRRLVAGRGVSAADLALAQRAELHLDLPDSALIELAVSAGRLAVAR